MILYVDSGCYYELDENTTAIQSPGYPYAYTANMFCQWLIRVPEDNIIAINLIRLVSEATNDRLTIYDGPNNSSRLLGTYSGAHNNEQINSSSNSIFLQFRSDYSINSDGFSIRYSTVNKTLSSNFILLLINII